MKRIVIFLLAGLIIGGCSAVPLRTMWRLRNFSVQNVASIDPNELRARIILPVDKFLEPGKSHIAIELIDDKGQVDSYKFPLEVVGREEITQGRFRKKRVSVSTLRLSHQAVSDFVRFQKGLQTKERKHRRAGVHVSSAFRRSEPFEKDETLKPFELSILLKLSAEEDYFTLINKAKIVPSIKSEQKNRTEGKKE